MWWGVRMEPEIIMKRLNIVDEKLPESPEAVRLRFERACLLDQMGSTMDAQNAYLDILSRNPTHRDALNNLGTLLHRTGYRTAAKTAYRQAVAHHPSHPMGQVNLANLLVEDGDLMAAQSHYENALRLDPDHFEAHQGLSYVLAEFGDEPGATFHRQKGFQNHPIIKLPYYGDGTPISVLVLMSAVGGNTPIRNFLDNKTYQTYVVIAEFCTPNVVLPSHQLVINAISDADLSATALSAAENILIRTSVPVINLPSQILPTGRVAITQRLAGQPGILAPKTVLVSREVLASPNAAAMLESHGLQFPILLRSPGFHTGRHFLRVESPNTLSAALETLPGAHLIVIQYLNTYGSDGKVRKYRVMMINGRLYPLHLAISSDWKVHYYTAGMTDNAAHRAEELEFLENMPQVLGPRAMKSLAQIQNILRLDYAGIDFGLSGSREVLLFEANATMVVNPPEPDVRWDYRRQAVGRIFEAVRQMFLDKVFSGAR